MTTPFSRLTNFRQKKGITSQNNQDQFKLTIPSETDSYKPSSIHQSRNNTRLLKGKIDKSNPIVYDIENQFRSTKVVPDEKNHIPVSIPDQSAQSLKLVINDSPTQKKKQTQCNPQPSHNRTHKRINIIRQTPTPKQSIQQKTVKPQPQIIKPVKQQQPQIKQATLENVENIAIQECQQQQSNNLEQENDLVVCPEGCGRKFNRKALQKHAKACKTVFMSKRRQFNSEAKRLTSKQQATLIKQAKIKEKSSQFSKTKSKGFDKTGQNWKVASQEFRQALKGVKIQQGDSKLQQVDLAAKIVPCQFCEKKFNQIFIQKHLEKCLVKKQKEKKTAQKKRK